MQGLFIQLRDFRRPVKERVGPSALAKAYGETVRKVFQIGFNRCGARFVDKLFELNGYKAVNWAGGQLAEDIVYSVDAGEKPLSIWADKFTVFSNLDSIHNLSVPMMHGYRHFAALDKNYEGSLFVLNMRNIEDWISSRFNHRNGEYAELYSAHLNVDMRSLPDIWRGEWERHIAGCREYFGGRREFIEIEIDTFQQDDYKRAFAPWYEFDKVPPLPGAKIVARRKLYRSEAIKRIGSERKAATPSEQARAAASQRISAHCTGRKADVPSREFLSWSNLFVAGTIGLGRFVDRNGDRVPIVTSRTGKFSFRRWHDKAVRPVGVLNDIVALNLPWVADMELAIDMQDARQAGLETTGVPQRPVISYCRREGAQGVFLWPLPEYHSIGARNFLNDTVEDAVSFAEKEDKVVWRGNLSGHFSDVCSGIFENPAYATLKNIVEDRNAGRDVAPYLDILRLNVRYRIVSDNLYSPDCDFRLTPSVNGREALLSVGRGLLLDDYKDEAFFHRYRYVLSMRGFDTGSNFISAANTNSVVLKEEDGWELFYTCLFEPWVHYIPLRAGCPDLAEKLDWARANPAQCEEITRNARDVCRLLGDKALRACFLEKILLEYRAF